MSGYTFKVATDPDEFDQIHQRNYRTFVEEIPQHEPNPTRSLIDRFHAENTYVVARKDGRVVGMVCVRDRRPFSVDQKIGRFEDHLPEGVAAPLQPCEIRLLAIEPGHRRARIILGLLSEIARIALERGCDFAIISGRVANLSLYRALGFRPFGPLTGSAEAPYQPMYASADLFARAQGRGRIVAAAGGTRSGRAGPPQVTTRPGTYAAGTTSFRRALPYSAPMSSSRPAPRTLDALIADYLRTVPSSKRSGIEGSLELLRTAIDGYGHQYLTPTESARWAGASAAAGLAEDDENLPFSQVFGAKHLVKYLDEFFGYFLIRKVILSPDEVAETVEHVRAFVAWLAETGAVTPAAARTSLARVAVAAEELPAAESLGEHLYRLAKRTSEQAAARRVAYDEVIEDYLVIERVAPARIWFIGGIGPIKVPEAASRVARAGWTVSIVIGRQDDRWDVLEVGNVYPETVA